MIELGVAALAGIVFAAICVAVLIVVGIMNIRAGRKALARARAEGKSIAWHRQVLILFGLNNIVFAALLALVVLLAVLLDRSAKLVIIGLLAVLFVVSIVLVVRCVMSVMQASRELTRPRQDI
ncbi:hypothetical protein [Dictyobacter aurantiacus]|uniref:Uncharacterized protein n=1 Tax=Dictyobacter aurantiacus TaxID=1936993 RepID=A0A401ZDN5_9CHLR|nr:hypothetical protein [Dictyobacter aurantiacus]GCE04987.1 hypothetical protein KDAU_23160 [Dictyobacter aurantiacus]